MASSQAELTPQEKELFKYINERNYEEVKRLLTTGNISVNCVCENGMTPLQHSAYKGDYKLCKLLLDCGADVNMTRHESQYSALMFAGLSGKVVVVNLLLEHGASISSTNSINKTASQMAAFVGNHDAVSAINNFIKLEEIEFFTKINGLETEPKLPSHLCHVVHKMAILPNIHPVKLVMYVQNNLSILENVKKVVKVFNLLCEEKYNEGNELLSLKFHHLAFVLSYCEKFCVEYKEKQAAVDSDKKLLTVLIKYWIKQNDNELQDKLENFLRQDIKEYPIPTNTLFQQLVRTLSSQDAPNGVAAVHLLTHIICNRGSLDEIYLCGTCGEYNAEKKCGACKVIRYCDRNCQKLHWFSHKLFCRDPAEQKEETTIPKCNEIPDSDSAEQKAETTIPKYNKIPDSDSAEQQEEATIPKCNEILDSDSAGPSNCNN